MVGSPSPALALTASPQAALFQSVWVSVLPIRGPGSHRRGGSGQVGTRGDRAGGLGWDGKARMGLEGTGGKG